jgi:hypothetical protein
MNKGTIVRKHNLFGIEGLAKVLDILHGEESFIMSYQLQDCDTGKKYFASFSQRDISQGTYIEELNKNNPVKVYDLDYKWHTFENMAAFANEICKLLYESCEFIDENELVVHYLEQCPEALEFCKFMWVYRDDDDRKVDVKTWSWAEVA